MPHACLEVWSNLLLRCSTMQPVEVYAARFKKELSTKWPVRHRSEELKLKRALLMHFVRNCTSYSISRWQSKWSKPAQPDLPGLTPHATQHTLHTKGTHTTQVHAHPNLAVLHSTPAAHRHYHALHHTCRTHTTDQFLHCKQSTHTDRASRDKAPPRRCSVLDGSSSPLAQGDQAGSTKLHSGAPPCAPPASTRMQEPASTAHPRLPVVGPFLFTSGGGRSGRQQKG
jgi:hypothetical protein